MSGKFALNAKAGVDSKLVSKLSGRRLVVETSVDHSHPLLAVCHNWSEFSASLLRLLTNLSKNEITAANEAVELHIQFRDLVYRAAELFEAYIKTIPSTLPISRLRPHKIAFTAFTEAAKRHKAKWGLICNAIKHRNNKLLDVACYKNNLGIQFFGFSLLEPSGLTAAVRNKDLHKNREAHQAYNCVLLELVFDLLQTDHLASSLIDSLPDDTAEKIEIHAQEILSEDVLNRLLIRPIISFPDQKRAFNGVVRAGQILTLVRLISMQPDQVEVTVTLTVGPLTRSFEVLPPGLSHA